MRGAVPDEAHEDTTLGLGHLGLEFFRGADRFVIDVGYDVAGLDLVAIGQGSGLDLGDDDAAGDFDFELFAQLLGQRFDGHAQLHHAGGLFGGFGLAAGGQHVAGRLLIGLHLDADFFVATEDIQHDLGAGLLAGDEAAQLLSGGHGLSVHRNDDVGRLELRPVGRPAGFDGTHHHAIFGLGVDVAEPAILPKIGDPDSQPGPDELAVFDEAIADFTGQIGGDGKADADPDAHGRADHGIHAHDLAVDVDQRAAGIAHVDIGIGLDEILVGQRPHVFNLTALGTDVAEGDAVLEVEGSANGDGELTHPDLVGVGELHRNQARDLFAQLNHRQIGLGIPAADLGLHLAPILEDHQNGLGVFDNMVVGEDVTVFAHDHSGPASIVKRIALSIGRIGLRALTTGLLTAEPFEEPLELLALLLGQLLQEGVSSQFAALAIFTGLDLDDHHRLGHRVGHFDERLIELPRQVQDRTGRTRRGFLGHNGNGKERRQQRSPTARKQRIRTHHGVTITLTSLRASGSVAST